MREKRERGLNPKLLQRHRPIKKTKKIFFFFFKYYMTLELDMRERNMTPVEQQTGS